MRIPLVKGRYFDERDTKGAPETVIVDESLAERFWPNEDPIGKRLQRGGSGAWRTVVGMISNSRQYSAEKEPPIAVYYPFEQFSARNMFLVIRTTRDPAGMIEPMTKEIQALDPEMSGARRAASQRQAAGYPASDGADLYWHRGRVGGRFRADASFIQPALWSQRN
jgi:hypothetical protein